MKKLLFILFFIPIISFSQEQIKNEKNSADTIQKKIDPLLILKKSITRSIDYNISKISCTNGLIEASVRAISLENQKPSIYFILEYHSSYFDLPFTKYFTESDVDEINDELNKLDQASIIDAVKGYDFFQSHYLTNNNTEIGYTVKNGIVSWELLLQDDNDLYWNVYFVRNGKRLVDTFIDAKEKMNSLKN